MNEQNEQDEQSNEQAIKDVQPMPVHECRYCGSTKMVSRGFTAMDMSVPTGRSYTRNVEVWECERCHLVAMVSQRDHIVDGPGLPEGTRA